MSKPTVTQEADLFRSLSPEEFAVLSEREGPRIRADIERAFAESAKVYPGPPPMQIMPRTW